MSVLSEKESNYNESRDNMQNQDNDISQNNQSKSYMYNYSISPKVDKEQQRQISYQYQENSSPTFFSNNPKQYPYHFKYSNSTKGENFQNHFKYSSIRDNLQMNSNENPLELSNNELNEDDIYSYRKKIKDEKNNNSNRVEVESKNERENKMIRKNEFNNWYDECKNSKFYVGDENNDINKNTNSPIKKSENSFREKYEAYGKEKEILSNHEEIVDKEENQEDKMEILNNEIYKIRSSLKDINNKFYPDKPCFIKNKYADLF